MSDMLTWIYRRLFAVLLFLADSLLLAEGALSMRTGFERVGQVLRRGSAA
ncbi:hypothetical protein [Sphingobium yanoikuyae]|nr:hypothetical protein [Sphingobium yanoikuyae]